MRLLFFPFVTTLFILSGAPTASAQSDIFTTTLSLGARGPQVTLLQQILNRDPETRVASIGDGSPGKETDYFGSLTKNAVIRFQEKHAQTILAPIGLTAGTGVVGPATRPALSSIQNLSVRQDNSIPPVAVTSAPSTSTTDSTNPNLKNIDSYIATVQKLGLKEGLSPETLSLIEQKIRAQAATTTTFQEMFFNQQKAAYAKKISADTSRFPLLAFFEKAFSFIIQPLMAEKAYAGLGLPFGGYITYINPAICDCPPGIVTQIFVALPAANPLTSNLLLNYINGSELFSAYNIPRLGIGTVGSYILTPISSCVTYVGVACVPVPSEGQITPQVGSSLLPPVFP